MTARYLNATAVADYLSISRAMVDILVSRGKLPAPVELTPRLKRWDRLAIDNMLAGDIPGFTPLPQTAAELSRGIADGIIAERRVPPTKAPRQRSRSNILPLARDRGED